MLVVCSNIPYKLQFFTFIFAVLLPYCSIEFSTVGTVKTVERRTASPSQISSKSVEPRPGYGDFFRFFQDGGRPPSWICNACVETTHEGLLVVFITVQNAVGIDAVVLIGLICMFLDFASLAWKRLFTRQHSTDLSAAHAIQSTYCSQTLTQTNDLRSH